jgi:hypothetical protein
MRDATARKILAGTTVGRAEITHCELEEGRCEALMPPGPVNAATDGVLTMAPPPRFINGNSYQNDAPGFTFVVRSMTIDFPKPAALRLAMEGHK